MSSSGERDAFLAIDEEEGALSAIPLKSGDVIWDVTEWEFGEPAEDSSVDTKRYVMSRKEFLRLWEWMKGLV